MNFKPFLALEASAGSGKTFALSVRFVALVLKGAKISEILAITFTNKAANEMKTRIISAFLDLHETSKANELKELCALLGKNEAEILALRDEKKNEFLRSELKIKTFDSFFASIVRSFSLNLGLMSDFSISENAMNANAKFISLLSDKELENLARYILSTQTQANFFENLEFLYENSYPNIHFNAPYPAKELVNVDEAYQNLKNYALPQSQNVNFQKNFSFDSINKDNINEFCKKPIIAEFGGKKYFESVQNDDAFLQKRAALLMSLNAYANALEGYKLGILMNYLSHFKRAKELIIKEQNTLSFGDIAKKTNELLTQNELKEMIYFRLDGYIAHLLIDEFQDTSVLQYEILKPLIAEIVSGKGTRDFKSFFYVGDKKQSIYRFRQGKKELFDLLQKDFPQIQRESLKTNYRSKEVLVRFINHTFAKFYPNYETQQSVAGKNGGFVRIVRSNENENAKKDEIFEETFRTLCEQLDILKAHNVSENDICVLCWKNEDADNIVARLKENGFNAYTQSSIALEKKASVCLLLSYAKYCIFGDEYYNELIKSLLGKEIAKIRLDIADNPARIVRFLAGKLQLDLSDSAMIQLVEFAATKENFLELLFEPLTQKLVNEENLGISVMTVHKSKGLEFDNVILLDTLSRPQNETNTLLLEYDTDKAAWELHIKDAVREFGADTNYTEFLVKKRAYEKDDAINKLYVAMTRAKNALIVIKRNNDKASLFASIECAEFGAVQNESVIKQDEQNSAKDELMLFEKVPKQEKQAITNEPRSKEIYFGNAFHYFMQHYNFKAKSNFEAVLSATKHKFHHLLDDEMMNELLKRVKNLLANAEFTSLLKGKILQKERNLSFNGELKQLDLLCVDENEAIIIDYKTGISDEAGHKEQVSFYKKAVQGILKQSVRAFVVYCLAEKTELKEVN